MEQKQIIYLVLAPIIVWRFLLALPQAQIGEQLAKPWRLWLSVTIFPLFFLLFGWACLSNTTALATLAGSAAMAVSPCLSWSLNLTRFETEAGKLYYRPNAYIGMGLMMVLAARVVYRAMPRKSPHPQDPAQALAGSPITLVIVGVLFCYYASYSAGILRRLPK